jgi:hypothetical protein
MNTTKTSLSRKRALSEIKLDEWLSYNPLFETYIPEFSEAFNRGSSLDLNYYINRTRNKGNRYYEDELCESLFPTSSIAKLSYLSAKVGNGKTSLCRYITEKLNKQKDYLVIYLDIGSSEIKTSNIISLFRDAILNVLKEKHIVTKKREFCDGIFNKSGFDDLTLIQKYDKYNDLNYQEIIDYIDDLSDIQKILIIIDNIDECNMEIINFCEYFAKNLQKYCNKLKKTYSILLPARETTVKKYFDQEHFADNPLPKIDEIEIIKKALSQSIDKIKGSMGQYSQSIEYPKIKGPYSFPSITIIMTKESAEIFLSRLIETVKTSIFWYLCRALSNENYKIMTSHIYNFIHSCKLPITPLFSLIWLKDFYITHNLEIPEYMSFNIGLETLLAIHYPFFDKKASLITNVFNLKDSVSPGDHVNTLILIRLLCFLQNNTDQNKYLREIIETFNKYEYSIDNIKAAIEKCFEYGLIEAAYGNHLADLSDNSEIKISSIGKFYIDVLICNDTYLSFMADDTPMPDMFFQDIGKKYKKHGHEHTKFSHIIKQASDTFINFIKTEEKLEKNSMKSKNYDYKDFLSRMSFKKDSEPITIGEYIELNRNQPISIDMIEIYF